MLLCLVILNAHTQEHAVPNPLRNAYFGDLHVHTGLSFDAAGAGTETLPEDAYRFARGEERIYLGRRVRRDTPLDFLAVTDHAEYLGMVVLAADPNGAFADTGWPAALAEPDAQFGRGNPPAARGQSAQPPSRADRRRFARSGFRGEDPIVEFLSPAIKRSNWQLIIDAAEAFNDPGSFTTFVAYEWSPMPGGAHLHRNVIFRGPGYPEFPFSAVDSHRPEDLWAWIERHRAAGIDAVLIPHNPNLSNGLAFAFTDSDGALIDRDYAEMRLRNERLVEITQVKGTSETRPELSPDDMFAAFEVLDHFVGSGLGQFEGSYARNALARGLEIAARTGVNPFAFGMIGSGDFHSGVAGSEEDNYSGALGTGDDIAFPDRVLNETSPILRAPVGIVSASGLTGVWAEANTRESLFDAMKRREVFATSGPTIQVRLFAGWHYRAGLIDEPDWLATAYSEGVPMGADITGAAAGAAALSPRFLVEAVKDPNSGHLDRIQIVKVWHRDGESFEQVFDVAWSGERRPDAAGKVPPVGNTVDLATATYSNDIGAARLAAEWTDAAFDPDVAAVYYARVIEIPTPRWTTYLAVRSGLPVPEDLPPVLQERAWTSPIFYTPSR